MLKFMFSIEADVYSSGVTEEGQRYTAERYYVQAETASGRRFRHFTNFNTSVRVEERTEDGDYFVYFTDTREEARAKAKRLLNRILEVNGDLDFEYWTEVDPRYGSMAYVNQGVEEARWMAERIEAMGC